jgi:hypothetical protein
LTADDHLALCINAVHLSDEPHVCPAHRFADGLGVSGIVLL